MLCSFEPTPITFNSHLPTCTSYTHVSFIYFRHVTTPWSVLCFDFHLKCCCHCHPMSAGKLGSVRRRFVAFASKLRTTSEHSPIRIVAKFCYSCLSISNLPCRRFRRHLSPNMKGHVSLCTHNNNNNLLSRMLHETRIYRPIGFNQQSYRLKALGQY